MALIYCLRGALFTHFEHTGDGACSGGADALLDLHLGALVEERLVDILEGNIFHILARDALLAPLLGLYEVELLVGVAALHLIEDTALGNHNNLLHFGASAVGEIPAVEPA